MNTMKLGKTGITISRMGLGTWAIGGGPAWGGDKDLATCIDTIRSCLFHNPDIHAIPILHTSGNIIGYIRTRLLQSGIQDII